MITTFLLLGLSICAVWSPSIKLGGRQIAPWIVLFICALGSGLFLGFLKPAAIVELGVFVICAYLSKNATANSWQRILFSSITLIGALALAMHLLPGFNNPVIISNFKFSADAAPYTQYLNFDKGAVGLVLLAFLCSRSRTVADWKKTLHKTYPVAIATTTVVILTAVMSGFIKLEFKVSSYTLTFLATNLLFTCVAEEAFFRGFLQDRFATSLTRFRHGGAIAIVLSSVLFGLVHAGGGTTYVFFATLVGFGSACAYAITKRIEAPILTHFILNAVHFIFFTYPHL
jgi:membrane protease YdiL (CAAX protease family)